MGSLLLLRRARATLIATLLASAVFTGLAVCDAAVAATVDGTVASSAENAGVAGARVEIWREISGEWSREAVAICDFDGRWTYSTADTSTVRLRALDPSGGHAAAWLGGTSVLSAADVTPSSAGTGTSITLQFLHGASLVGWAVEEETDLPLEGIRVTAWRVGVPDPVSHTGITADDGFVHIAGLPPGMYMVRFDDPTLAFDSQYWWMASSPAEADIHEVAGPGLYWALGVLGRHTTALSLTSAAASADSTLSPMIGGTIALETTATDSNLGGRPRDGIPVQLYSSVNGSSKWTRVNVGVTNISPGRYRASVPITEVGTMYYRFSAPAAAYRAAADSAVCAVTSRGPTYWSSGPEVEPGYSANPIPGAVTALSAVLVRGDGSAAPGRRVVLQARATGVASWAVSDVPVEDMGAGRYRARFSPGFMLSYRFATVGTSSEPPVASADREVPVDSGSVGRWSDYGSEARGTHFLLNNSTTYGGACVVNGLCRGTDLASAPYAELLQSPDGVNWTRSPVTVTKKAYSSGGVLYSARVTGIRGFRYFSLVMTGTATYTQRSSTPPVQCEVKPVLSSVSVKSRVKPRRRFTLSAKTTPRLVAGAKVGAVQVVRASNGRTYATFKTAVYDSGSGSAFRCTLSLPKGKYRLYPYVMQGGSNGPWGRVTRWSQSKYGFYKTVVVR